MMTSIISLSSLTRDYVQRKRKTRKTSSHSTLSLLRRELREGNLQSLFGGSSCIVSSSSAAPDPLISSFILPMADEFGSPQSRTSAETNPVKRNTAETASERYSILSLQYVRLLPMAIFGELALAVLMIHNFGKLLS